MKFYDMSHFVRSNGKETVQRAHCALQGKKSSPSFKLKPGTWCSSFNPCFLQTITHLKDSEKAKQIKKDDCDGHLAGEDEEGEVEGVAGDDGLVEEVHAEAADEVEGGCRDGAGLALHVHHRHYLLTIPTFTVSLPYYSLSRWMNGQRYRNSASPQLCLLNAGFYYTDRLPSQRIASWHFTLSLLPFQA